MDNWTTLCKIAKKIVYRFGFGWYGNKEFSIENVIFYVTTLVASNDYLVKM